VEKRSKSRKGKKRGECEEEEAFHKEGRARVKQERCENVTNRIKEGV